MKIKIAAILAVIAIVVTGLPRDADAQQFRIGPMQHIAGTLGMATVVEPTEIWTAPPHGFLNLFVGSKIQDVDPGTVVAINDLMKVYGITGPQIWYKVAPIDPDHNVTADGGAEDNIGWLYGGILKDSSTVRFGEFLDQK